MERFPLVEPWDTGMLDVGDGHHLYWEQSGAPHGEPVVVLHGGPGTGSSPSGRRWFDPSHHRIIQFDQRNSGRSVPTAAERVVDLTTNTTAHLVADIERLREHLELDRWLVFGASWGTTLGLAYAQTHPQNVSAMVLVSVVTTTRREVEWVAHDMGRVFPAEWERLRTVVLGADAPAEISGIELVAACGDLLHRDDPEVRERAALAWCAWEDTHVATYPGHVADPRFDDPGFRLAFARLVTHYWRHAAFLDDGQLLRDAHRLAGTPGVLVHGRLDISGPPDIAWRLAQVWPDAELVLVGDAGHGASSSAMTTAILTAVASMSGR